jgi:hypothetical protein
MMTGVLGLPILLIMVSPRGPPGREVGRVGISARATCVNKFILPQVVRGFNVNLL